jgi:hypothetical protein
VAEHAASDSTERDLAAVTRALDDARREVAQLSDALGRISNPVAVESVMLRLDQAGERVTRLEQERNALLRRQQDKDAFIEGLTALQVWWHTVTENARELTYEQKQLALRALRGSVKVFPKESEERWRVVLRVPGRDCLAYSSTGHSLPSLVDTSPSICSAG